MRIVRGIRRGECRPFRGLKERREWMAGKKEEVDDPHTSAAKQKRPLRIGAELLLAERPSCSCVFFRAVEHTVHGVCRSLLCRVVEMCIDVCRGGESTVTQPDLDLLHGDTVLPVFDTTSPGKGGGWNRAGARHGSFTPPRFSRSCIQEYHCKLTGSWRISLPKLHLTWVGIALHLLLAVLICGECSAQVVLAHPV